MPIDPIGGPKGPGGPTDVPPIEDAGLEKPASVEETPKAADVAPPEAVDSTVIESVDAVAAELRAGDIPSVEAAFERLIERIVEARYSEMSARQRDRFKVALGDLLKGDPVIGARIKEMLQPPE